MNKVHLHFALVLSIVIMVLGGWLMSLDKPMTNFMGMMLCAVALLCGGFSLIEFKLRQDNQSY